MKRILLLSALFALACSSCNLMEYHRVKGNGVIISQDRTVNFNGKIKLSGSYDVEITQGTANSVKVTGDENILPYILTEEKNGFLVIKSKDHISISTENNIKVVITTTRLDQVELAGSGNIIGKTKFTGSNKLTLKIAGSGDMTIDVNVPDISASIAGSGSITLTGETKDEDVTISGVGDYNADGLKAESAKVKIAGSGNVKVFADVNLDVSIAGVGSVFYKGAASIKQHIAGSGEIKKID